MKKRKSVKTKMIGIIGFALLAVFVILNFVVGKIIKDEVMEQWKTDDYALVKVYSELMVAEGCDTTEEYQQFIEDIYAENTFNYALYIEDIDGVVTAVAHSNQDRIGIELTDTGSVAAARDGESYVGYFTDPTTGGLTLDVLTPIYNDDGSLKGALNIGIPIDSATIFSILKSSLSKTMLVCMVSALVLLILLGQCIRIILIDPIRLLSKNMERMAHYDLSVEEKNKLQRYQRRRDEIGSMSQSFQRMIESMSSMILSITHVAGDLTDQADSLSQACMQVSDSSSQLNATVDEVAQGATTQAQQTAEGEAEIQKLSALLEQMHDNMNSLDQATQEVEEIRKSGMEALNQLIEQTKESSENSSQVHDVIGKTSLQADKIQDASSQIREIASQTNLLALNASIEAARAGEAGKGFAVVATEIGNLAGQTNELTTQIEGIISVLIEKMAETVKQMESMQHSVEYQTDGVEQIAKQFNRIAAQIARMGEQCDTLHVSTQSMEQSRRSIIGVITDLSAMSEENAACMQEAAASVGLQTQTVEAVSVSSRDVAALAETLEKEIEKFHLTPEQKLA